jgi:hypothetical protein
MKNALLFLFLLSASAYGQFNGAVMTGGTVPQTITGHAVIVGGTATLSTTNGGIINATTAATSGSATVSGSSVVSGSAAVSGQVSGTSASSVGSLSFSSTTVPGATNTVTTSGSGPNALPQLNGASMNAGGLGAGGNIVMVSSLPSVNGTSIHGNWVDTLTVQGTGTLSVLENSAGITSGSFVPILQGVDTMTLVGGTSATLTNGTNAAINLSGTTFAVTNRSLIIETGSCHITGTGTDDWAVMQAALTSGSGRGLILYNDMPTSVSKSLRLFSDETIESDASEAHGIHLLPHSDMAIIDTILSQDQYSTHNVHVENLFLDCNGFNQDGAESYDPWNLQGDPGPGVNTIIGIWIGSATDWSIDGCTIYNPYQYSITTSWDKRFRITNNQNRFLYNSGTGVGFSGLWPYVITSGTTWSQATPSHHDGWHGFGPDSSWYVGNDTWRGDDDQLAKLPVEQTPEAQGWQYYSSPGWSGTSLVTVTTFPSTRRGHGGPITNGVEEGNVFDHSRSGVRFGQQVNISGTYSGVASWEAENVIEQVTNIGTSGTIYAPMANQGTTVVRAGFDQWNVESGTNGVADINFAQGNATHLSASNWVDGIRDDDPVFFLPSSTIGEELAIGGAYGAEIQHLRDNIFAAWTFEPGASGTGWLTDYSGNGVTLTNSNAVGFTIPTNGVNNGYATCATFASGSNQCLNVSGSSAAFFNAPAWTVALWAQVDSYSGNNFAVIMCSGTAGGITASCPFYLGFSASTSGAYLGILGTALQPGGAINQYGLGSWIYMCARKRATDGKIDFTINRTDGGGLQDTGWTSVPSGPFPASAANIWIGGDAQNSRYFTGYIAEPTIVLRCWSDRQVWENFRGGQQGNIQEGGIGANAGGSEFPWNH